MKTTVLNADLQYKAERICAQYPVKRAALLPVLHLVQETCGSISSQAELEVADYFDIPPADVREVVTFYTLFYSKPKGKCHIQLCRTLSCHLSGAPDLANHLNEKLGIQSGETTEDNQFSFDEVECMGACEIAPMAKINLEYEGPLTKEKLDQILERHKT